MYKKLYIIYKKNSLIYTKQLNSNYTKKNNLFHLYNKKLF